MKTVRFDELELDAVEGDAEEARWLAAFPFSPDRPGETTATGTDCTVVYNELDPDTQIEEHRDAVDELLLVLDGTVRARVGEHSHAVDAGTLAVIPAKTSHAIRNVGSETARMVGIFGTSPVESTFETEPVVTDDE